MAGLKCRYSLNGRQYVEALIERMLQLNASLSPYYFKYSLTIPLTSHSLSLSLANSKIIFGKEKCRGKHM